MSDQPASAPVLPPLSGAPSLDEQASGLPALGLPALAPAAQQARKRTIKIPTLQDEDDEDATTFRMDVCFKRHPTQHKRAYAAEIRSRLENLQVAVLPETSVSEKNNEIEVDAWGLKIGICGLESLQYCASKYRVIVSCGIVERRVKTALSVVTNGCSAMSQTVVIYSMGKEIPDTADFLPYLGEIAKHQSFALFESIRRTAGNGGVLFHCHKGQNRSALVAAMYVLFLSRRETLYGEEVTADTVIEQLQRLAAASSYPQRKVLTDGAKKGFKGIIDDFRQHVVKVELEYIQNGLESGIHDKLGAIDASSLLLESEKFVKYNTLVPPEGKKVFGYFNDQVLDLYFESFVQRFRSDTLMMSALSCQFLAFSEHNKWRLDFEFFDQDVVLLPSHNGVNHFFLGAFFPK